jgi:hypothetical protein
MEQAGVAACLHRHSILRGDGVALHMASCRLSIA